MQIGGIQVQYILYVQFLHFDSKVVWLILRVDSWCCILRGALSALAVFRYLRDLK